MPLRKLMPWAAAILSAVLLELPFPLAGPMPPWRGIIAFVGLVPLLWAILAPSESPRPLRHAFLIGYLCGILWYAGNCYWIYDTMHIHGRIPPVGSVGLLRIYSLVLGLYFGVFALALKFIANRFSTNIALIAAPFFWTALDLAAARITSVPWDQLGYSQVDNSGPSWLAPYTGVYGITYVIVGMNSLIAAGGLRNTRQGKKGWNALLFGIVWGCLAFGFRERLDTPVEQPTATAVLVQPNLDVDTGGSWPGPIWDQNLAQF